jgi:hypothetical protein
MSSPRLADEIGLDRDAKLVWCVWKPDLLSHPGKRQSGAVVRRGALIAKQPPHQAMLSAAVPKLIKMMRPMKAAKPKNIPAWTIQ